MRSHPTAPCRSPNDGSGMTDLGSSPISQHSRSKKPFAVASGPRNNRKRPPVTFSTFLLFVAVHATSRMIRRGT